MKKKIKDMTLSELVRTCQKNSCVYGCTSSCYCPLYSDFFEGYCHINDLNEYYDQLGDVEVEVEE